LGQQAASSLGSEPKLPVAQHQEGWQLVAEDLRVHGRLEVVLGMVPQALLLVEALTGDLGSVRGSYCSLQELFLAGQPSE
jgi:hypothetical protein